MNGSNNYNNHVSYGNVHDEEALEAGDSRTQLQNSFHHNHDQQQQQTEVTIRLLDADIVIRGYERRFGWILFIWLLIVLTAGMLGLVLLYWKPEWMLKLTHSVCPLAAARLVYIEDAYQQKYVRKLYTTSSMSDASMQQTHQLRMFLPLPESTTASSLHDANGVYIVDDEGNVEKLASIRWFQFQKHKLIWDPEHISFKPLVGPTSLSRAAANPQRGLSETEAKRRQMLYGKNELLIKVSSPFRTLVLEALNPFYIFQVYSFIVWYTEHYIYYAWVIVAMSALSLIYTTWQTHYLQRMRRDRFQSSGTVQVIRHQSCANDDSNGDRHHRQTFNGNGYLPNGDSFKDYARSRRESANGFVNLAADNTDHAAWHAHDDTSDIAQLPVSTDDVIVQQQHQPNGRRRSSGRPMTDVDGACEKTVGSNELVPGDIIVIPAHGCEMYCDAILLHGTCLVNEATLTGESIPVTKAAVEFVETDTFDNADGDADNTASAKQQQRLFYLSPTSSAEQRALGGTSKNMLYAGTKVIQTRYYNNEPVKAVVMRTGYCTVKGELVTSIMYPKPVDFSFHNDALKFLIVLAVFACIGMIYTFIILKIRGSPNSRLILRALDVVTIVVPPALPFAMTMGIVHAQSRLRKAGLFCISPRMINMAGSIDLVCFDKTGTLTEEGLSLRGVIPVAKKRNDCLHLAELIPANTLDNDKAQSKTLLQPKRSSSRRRGSIFGRRRSSAGTDSYKSYRNENFDEDAGVSPPPSQQQSSQPSGIPSELQMCMATCHELTLIEGTLSGDPLDLEMFRATGWELEEPSVHDNDKYDQIVPTIVRPPRADGRRGSSNGQSGGRYVADASNEDISILRVMSFESKLQRMSVVIRKASDTNDAASFCVCCKGAPEKIASLCLSETVPENFTDILTSYTQNGDRVLALAYRSLDTSMRFTRLQRMSRDALERDLQFLGFIVFENRLKPQTIPCIRELKSACIRTVMVTGDNLLTALSVGRQCNIIDTPEVTLLEVEGENGGQKLRRRVVSDTVACRGSAEPSTSQMSLRNGAIVDVEYQNGGSARCCALTGETFQMLHDGKNPTEYYHVLQNGAVFARMTPAQKELLVVGLRHAGFFVGMCGDGANDCGALKTAHMGISLSDQEASAAAPYTYKHANVSCVPTCIKEGRAALDTSFAAFKYMAAYSMTQFLSALILYAVRLLKRSFCLWAFVLKAVMTEPKYFFHPRRTQTNTNLSDFDFLYIDLFEVTLIVIVFGLTNASPRLARTAPPSRLIGIVPLLSLSLQVLIVLGIQVAAYLIVAAQPWYVPTVDDRPANATSFTNVTATATITAASAAVRNVTGNSTGPSELSDDNEHYFSYQNYAVFGVSTFQYVWLAIAFSRGWPYRRLIVTNWLLTLLCLILTAFNAFLILKPCSWIIWLVEIKMPPTWHFRWIIIGLAALNFVLALVCEWGFVAWLNKRLDRKQRRRKELESSTAALLSLTNAVHTQQQSAAPSPQPTDSLNQIEMERIGRK